MSVNVSMMVGCAGSAPIIVNLCTSAAARAPFPALDPGAGLAADGAALDESAGADSLGVDDGAVSLGESVCVSVVVIGAGVGTVTGATGIAGADMGDTGLMGDSGLVGLVTDLVHESLVKFH